MQVDKQSSDRQTRVWTERLGENFLDLIKKIVHYPISIQMVLKPPPDCKESKGILTIQI